MMMEGFEKFGKKRFRIYSSYFIAAIFEVSRIPNTWTNVVVVLESGEDDYLPGQT
jgi:hypothetical protein